MVDYQTKAVPIEAAVQFDTKAPLPDNVRIAYILVDEDGNDVGELEQGYWIVTKNGKTRAWTDSRIQETTEEKVSEL